jgi:2-polyprenyl-3-methyl-5-hydroxy-6-metoxy-1,4-benzoquinol methylase
MYDWFDIEKIYCSHEYEKDPYFSYDNQDITTISKGRFRSKNNTLELVEKFIGVGKVLDVGCGAGDFLLIAKNRGWEVTGVELSPGLFNICERKKYNVINSSFEDVDFPDHSFDLLTFWDVIEHVIDPVYCVMKAKRMLSSGGIAIFCTPNEDSLLAKIGLALYKVSASHYIYPALALHPKNHTFFFSKKGFKNLIEKTGMKWLKCYSQIAFFEHSELANSIQKYAIAGIERTAKLFDFCYEMVVFARA